jgi:hypothetical protein
MKYSKKFTKRRSAGSRMLICAACAAAVTARNFDFAANRQSSPRPLVDHTKERVPPAKAGSLVPCGDSTMRRLLVIFILVFTPVWAGPAHGQFFGRRNRPDPIQRVPELIVAVKTDANERKRANAAEELRDYDSKQFPEIVGVLIDVAQNDAGASVRSEAIASLAKIRPVSQEAGQVLENAAAKDPSARVRWQAKTSLWGYRMAGYNGAKTSGPTIVDKNSGKNGKFPMTQEPPLADQVVIIPGSSQPSPLPKVNITPAPQPLPEIQKSGSITPEFRPASNPRPVGGFSTAVPQQPRIINASPTPVPPAEQPREVNPLPLPLPQGPAPKDEGPPLTPPR